MGQPRVVRLRPVQHVQKCLVLAARNHEEALIEQSLFRSLVGCIKNEIGQRLVGHFGRTAQHSLLLWGRTQAVIPNWSRIQTMCGQSRSDFKMSSSKSLVSSRKRSQQTKPATLLVSDRLMSLEVDLLRQSKRSIADYVQKVYQTPIVVTASLAWQSLENRFRGGFCFLGNRPLEPSLSNTIDSSSKLLKHCP